MSAINFFYSLFLIFWPTLQIRQQFCTLRFVSHGGSVRLSKIKNIKNFPGLHMWLILHLWRYLGIKGKDVLKSKFWGAPSQIPSRWSSLNCNKTKFVAWLSSSHRLQSCTITCGIFSTKPYFGKYMWCYGSSHCWCLVMGCGLWCTTVHQEPSMISYFSNQFTTSLQVWMWTVDDTGWLAAVFLSNQQIWGYT